MFIKMIQLVDSSAQYKINWFGFFSTQNIRVYFVLLLINLMYSKEKKVELYLITDSNEFKAIYFTLWNMFTIHCETTVNSTHCKHCSSIYTHFSSQRKFQTAKLIFWFWKILEIQMPKIVNLCKQFQFQYTRIYN